MSVHLFVQRIRHLAVVVLASQEANHRHFMRHKCGKRRFGGAESLIVVGWWFLICSMAHRKAIMKCQRPAPESLIQFQRNDIMQQGGNKVLTFLSFIQPTFWISSSRSLGTRVKASILPSGHSFQFAPAFHQTS